MLKFNKTDSSKPKCFFTQSVLPTFVDHAQVPMKKLPFATINRRPSIHTLDIVLPESTSDGFRQSLAASVGTLKYLKVYLKLTDILRGDLFNQYIKSGNILMLSQSKGTDTTFSLSEGLLRLEVDKATFQRCGLEGKPVPDKGRKHVNTRYVMEFDLRRPSMVRGKKGFERIIWAATNVLNHTTTWLFYDFKGPNDGSGPISHHQPKVQEIQPLIDTTEGVLIPAFEGDFDAATGAEALELLEWLTLLTSNSPRVQESDRIDTHLSRYEAPCSQYTAQSVESVIRWRWHGFLSASYIQQITLCAFKASGNQWFAMSAATFNDTSYMILQHKQQTLTWEYED